MSVAPVSSIGFIGSGRVTRLLLQALSAKEALPSRIIVSDPDESKLELISSIAPDIIECRTDNQPVAEADFVFFAVHPPVVETVMADIRDTIKDQSVLASFVPGTSLQRLTTGLNGFRRLVRMIPNAPSIIHQGYNPVVFSSELQSGEKSQLLSMFEHWGTTVEVEEEKLETYAVLTGMGPTYFWFQWLELLELGKSFGMPEKELKAALAAMLHGAADLLFNSNFSAEEVLDLIPGYPMKPHEADIITKLSRTVKGLHSKLSTSG
jgi:pyrroline-5-carboxylate reductase